MNMKLWIIVAISTLMLQNKTDEFSINFKSKSETYTLDVKAIKSTYWNIDIPDEGDKNKLIPLNYTISDDGVFKTILMNEVKISEFMTFTDVDWDEISKVDLLKEGAKDIKIDRDEKNKKITFSQKKGELLPDSVEVTVVWK